MSVFRSNKQIYVQVIDDLSGRTLAAASSLGMEAMPKKEQAAKVGELIAKKAQDTGGFYLWPRTALSTLFPRSTCRNWTTH